MIEIIPGDPASFMLGINAEPETVDALRKELGLDISTFERYFNYRASSIAGGTNEVQKNIVAKLVLGL